MTTTDKAPEQISAIFCRGCKKHLGKVVMLQDGTRAFDAGFQLYRSLDTWCTHCNKPFKFVPKRQKQNKSQLIATTNLG